jgi:hypothetical protein
MAGFLRSPSLPDNGSMNVTITTQGGTKVVPAGYCESLFFALLN